VRPKVRHRIVRGGKDLDLKTLEERSRAEIVCRQDRLNGVEEIIGTAGVRLTIDTEELGERGLEPVPGSGPGEEVPMLAPERSSRPSRSSGIPAA
jgi:hypothetical protein